MDWEVYDVLICHTSATKLITNSVVARLEATGVRCWIAPRDILPGLVWAAAITEGIRSVKLMVVVFSEHVGTSEPCLREVDQALSRGLSIITFRIDGRKPTNAIEFDLKAKH